MTWSFSTATGLTFGQPAAGNPGWVWSQVGVLQWVAVAWWATLAVVASAGLVILLVSRRQAVSRGRLAILMTIAGLGVVGYGASMIVELFADLS